MEVKYEEEEDGDNETNKRDTIEMNNWELFLQMKPKNNVILNKIKMLDSHEFDKNYIWDQLAISQHLHKSAQHNPYT